MNRWRMGAAIAMLLVLMGCGGQQAATTSEAPATSGAGETAGGAPAPATDGAIAITVTEDGFEPPIVTVAAGQPVKLIVTRKTTKTCATELVMKEHNINQPLPLDTPVEISFTPTQAGELTYACAMDMYKGKVVVK